MQILLKKLKHRIKLLLYPEFQDTIRKEQRTRQKIEYGKSIISNGSLPMAFSIILGKAPCNHSCLFCPQSIQKPKKSEWLDLDLLQKILEEIPEHNIEIPTTSYCESMFTPHLVPAVKLMKTLRPHLRVVLATNGSVLKEDVVEGLIDAGLDRYSYSFDAATRETYNVLMQKDDYDKVWRNLERIVEIRDQKKSSMEITTHIMHFKGVEEDFEHFRKHWSDKLTTAYLRTVSNWGNEQLGLMKQLREKGFVSAHETPEERYPCTSIFMHFKVQYDGEYYPCVAAIPDFPHSVPSLGNARKITWTEAWNRLSKMRQAHLHGRWDDYECCRTCNVWSMWDNMWFQETSPDGTLRQFYLKEIEHAR